MNNRYDNYKRYVNSLKASDEISMISLSLICYIGFTSMFMIMVCLLGFWNLIIRTVFIILPIVFAAFIVFLVAWYLKLKKVISDYTIALLYNGLSSFITTCMFFSCSWIMLYFSEVSFSVIHIGLVIAFTVLLIIGAIYLYFTCRNGKKKTHSRVSIISSVILIAGFARFFARNDFMSNVLIDDDIMAMSLGCLVLGFIELFCAIIELSKYYVSKKYDVALEN